MYNNYRHHSFCQLFDLAQLAAKPGFTVLYDPTVILSEAFTLFCYIYLVCQIHTPTVTIWGKATKAVKYI